MKLGKAHNVSTWWLHIFLFYREQIFRKVFPIMVFLAIYALVIVFVEKNTTKLRGLDALNLGQFHLIFSFVLGILVSFRINSSFNRWWEGRVLWGSIVNNCRNIAMKFDTFIGLDNHAEFRQILSVLPEIMKYHLRDEKLLISKKFRELELVSHKGDNPVVFLLQKMYIIINTLRNEDKIRFEQYMVLDTHLANLTDLIGGCERINNTPVPSAFAFFVKQGMLFYALIFPFGWAEDFGYLIIPLILMIVYILLGLEILAEELECPFGADDNDLPLDLIAINLTKSIAQIAKAHK